ncbi:hypothetical protein [Azospirillum sp. SYSU D00513]|uniref:hypothetical protein n=1 Tax=Azospirillum sp. SYSU D00513 TaxID=2812561 RepID=UPI001A975275|nr:hypothetical protein [Azospirillum sp. SYSU D00513]
MAHYEVQFGHLKSLRGILHGEETVPEFYVEQAKAEVPALRVYWAGREAVDTEHDVPRLRALSNEACERADQARYRFIDFPAVTLEDALFKLRVTFEEYGEDAAGYPCDVLLSEILKLAPSHGGENG